MKKKTIESVNENEKNNNILENNIILNYKDYPKENRNSSKIIRKSSSVRTFFSKSQNNLSSNKLLLSYSSINKQDPSYFYMRELNKKKNSLNIIKNNIFKIIRKRIILRNSLKNNCYSLVYGKKELENYEIKQQKKLKEVHQKSMLNLINQNNPYSLYDLSKLLDRKYDLKINTKGFINGVPIIDLSKKKNNLFIDRSVKNNIYVNSKYDLPDIKSIKGVFSTNHYLDKMKKKCLYDSILNLDYNKNEKKNCEEKKVKKISLDNSEDEIHFTELKNIFSGKN